MKTLVLATPRSGSNAFVEHVTPDNGVCLYEYFSIEDMWTPRLDSNEQLDMETIAQHTYPPFPDLTEQYFDEMHLPEHSHYLRVDEQGLRYKTKEKPNWVDVQSEHARRLHILENLDTWTLKVMDIHHVKPWIMHELKQMADQTYVLLRRNRRDQILSMVAAGQSGQYHNVTYRPWEPELEITLDNSEIDKYAKRFEDHYSWISRYLDKTCEIVYYEDIIFDKQKIWKKNRVNKTYDQEHVFNTMLDHIGPGIVVHSQPRSGSTAYCDLLLKQNRVTCDMGQLLEKLYEQGVDEYDSYEFLSNGGYRVHKVVGRPDYALQRKQAYDHITSNLGKVSYVIKNFVDQDQSEDPDFVDSLSFMEQHVLTRDPLEQMLSLQLAQRTNKWATTRGGHDYKKLAEGFEVDFALQQNQQYLRDSCIAQRKLRELAERNNWQLVKYEELDFGVVLYDKQWSREEKLAFCKNLQIAEEIINEYS